VRAESSKQEHIQNMLRHSISAGILLLLLGIEQVSAGILVLVPHPDDDIITAAGIILNTTSRGGRYI